MLDNKRDQETTTKGMMDHLLRRVNVYISLCKRTVTGHINFYHRYSLLKDFISHDKFGPFKMH